MKIIITCICLLMVMCRVQAQCTYSDPLINKPTSGYGAEGTHTIGVDSILNPYFPGQYIRVYYPADVTTKVPTLFYSHAFGGNNPSGICGLYNFVAKKGYALVFVPYQTTVVTIANRYANLLNGFRTAARTYTNIIDTTRVGFLGWSFGGGASFANAYTCITENNWGQNGRFIYALAQWYTYNISQAQLQSFPSGTKLLTEIFNDDVTNDHRMAIDIFNNISIPNSEKDFLLLRSDTVGGNIYTADHTVPNTSAAFNAYDYYAYYRLLDALCDYTFNGSAAGKNVALGNGSAAQVTMPGGLKSLIEADNPAADTAMFLYPQSKYQYPCTDTQNLRSGYCSVLPTSIKTTSPTAKAAIYPNPVSEKINIVLPAGTTGDVCLYNITGQLVYRKNIAGLTAMLIDMSLYNNGLYILTIGGEVLKIIKD